jgi:hypothetical protein
MNQLQLELLVERLESLTSMIDRVEKALGEIAGRSFAGWLESRNGVRRRRAGR